jgi:protein-S-isoprenylcysteine O-methyltransferase Ste14
MYIGNLLILAGVAVASNSIPCLLTAVPLFVFIYVAIVAAEEDFLRRKFGEAFDAYLRDVPRWGLKIAGLAHTLRSMEFRWRRVVVKEYGTPSGWIGGLCLLGLLYLRNPTVADMHPNARAVLIIVLAMAAVLWLTARWLKKARIFIAD